VPGTYSFSINVADSRSQSISVPFSQTVTASGITIGVPPRVSSYPSTSRLRRLTRCRSRALLPLYSLRQWAPPIRRSSSPAAD
jgi:hypothetical protein